MSEKRKNITFRRIKGRVVPIRRQMTKREKAKGQLAVGGIVSGTAGTVLSFGSGVYAKNYPREIEELNKMGPDDRLILGKKPVIKRRTKTGKMFKRDREKLQEWMKSKRKFDAKRDEAISKINKRSRRWKSSFRTGGLLISFGSALGAGAYVEKKIGDDNPHLQKLGEITTEASVGYSSHRLQGIAYKLGTSDERLRLAKRYARTAWRRGGRKIFIKALGRRFGLR